MIEQFASFACVSELRHTVGETPIKHLRLEGDQPRKLSLLAKVEGENPTGTMKDRSAYYIIRKAVSEGQIHRDRPVTASSSGGFALAAARLCHALGVCFLPVIDPNTPPFIRSQLGCFCTRIHDFASSGCVYAAALRAYAGSKASTSRKVVLVLPDHGRVSGSTTVRRKATFGITSRLIRVTRRISLTQQSSRHPSCLSPPCARSPSA